MLPIGILLKRKRLFTLNALKTGNLAHMQTAFDINMLQKGSSIECERLFSRKTL